MLLNQRNLYLRSSHRFAFAFHLCRGQSHAHHVFFHVNSGDELLANARQTCHTEVANGTDETQLNRAIEHILIVKAQSRGTSLCHVLHQSSGAELPVVGEHAVFWHAIATNGGVSKLSTITNGGCWGKSSLMSTVLTRRLWLLSIY